MCWLCTFLQVRHYVTCLCEQSTWFDLARTNPIAKANAQCDGVLSPNCLRLCLCYNEGSWLAVSRSWSKLSNVFLQVRQTSTAQTISMSTGRARCLEAPVHRRHAFHNRSLAATITDHMRMMSAHTKSIFWASWTKKWSVCGGLLSHTGRFPYWVYVILDFQEKDIVLGRSNNLGQRLINLATTTRIQMSCMLTHHLAPHVLHSTIPAKHSSLCNVLYKCKCLKYK